MNELINNLRLQTAQFNNFLIENYLSGVKNIEDYPQPYEYLFDSFKTQSENVSFLGLTFANIDDIENIDLIPLKEAINQAAGISYLIEKAANIDELALNINGINTYNLSNTVNNIIAYGKEFNHDQTQTDAEIEELKQDNTLYFADNGTYKYSAYHLSTEESLTFLSNNSATAQVRTAFKSATKTFRYFSAIISRPQNLTTNYTGDKAFISSLLNTLTVLLVAISYIEPFFQKPSKVVQLFEQHIEEISAIQSSLFATLRG